MKRVLSMSATVIMTAVIILNVDVKAKEIPTTIKNRTEAAVQPLILDIPETGVIERTHNVHLYTQEDADLMKRVAMAEGQSEGPDGMYLILSVVVNRINDPDYPDSVEGVIFQKNAFSSVSDGNFDKVSVPSAECEEAFARIDAGEVCPEIIAFETVESNRLDEWFMEAFTYRHHRFYTKKNNDQWG